MYLRKPVVEHVRYSEDFDMQETQNWEEDKAKSKHCRIHKGNHWISFHWGLSEPIEMCITLFDEAAKRAHRDAQFPIDLANARALGKRLVEKATTHI